jgi:hypothetical protein
MPRVKKETVQLKSGGGIDHTILREGETPDEKKDILKEQLGGVQPPAPPVETRGRPKGAVSKKKKEVDPEVREKAEALARVSLMLVKLLVKRMPNPEPLTSDEEQIWVDGVQPVIEKYIPAEWSAEVSAIVTVGAILGPKFIKPQRAADLKPMFEKRPTQDDVDRLRAQP